MSMPSRKPDAILAGTPAGHDTASRHQWYARNLYGLVAAPPGAVVGAKNQGEQCLIAPADATLLFPALHPLASRERYRWWVVCGETALNFDPTPIEVRGYAVLPQALKFGYLVDEATVSPPGLDERADFFRFVAERNEAYTRHTARLAELTAADREPQPGDRAEVADITRELERLAHRVFDGHMG
jgi:hypothetical protein